MNELSKHVCHAAPLAYARQQGVHRGWGFTHVAAGSLWRFDGLCVFSGKSPPLKPCTWRAQRKQHLLMSHVRVDVIMCWFENANYLCIDAWLKTSAHLSVFKYAEKESRCPSLFFRMSSLTWHVTMLLILLKTCFFCENVKHQGDFLMFLFRLFFLTATPVGKITHGSLKPHKFPSSASLQLRRSCSQPT